MIDRMMPRWLEDRGYRYDSVDGDFTRAIDIDERGLIASYPDRFRRVI
jgi:hypothetical protein